MTLYTFRKFCFNLHLKCAQTSSFDVYHVKNKVAKNDRFPSSTWITICLHYRDSYTTFSIRPKKNSIDLSFSNGGKSVSRYQLIIESIQKHKTQQLSYTKFGASIRIANSLIQSEFDIHTANLIRLVNIIDKYALKFNN
jgi:hypothetical protein